MRHRQVRTHVAGLELELSVTLSNTGRSLTPGRYLSSSSCCRSRAVSNNSLACVTRAYPSAQEGLDSPPLTVTVTLNNTQYQLNRTFTYSWNSTPQVSVRSVTECSTCLVGKVIGIAVIDNIELEMHHP